MLTHLDISNFKAWSEARLDFGKVTAFFGTNSAGKSSLLQFLLMLKQTRNATDRGLVLDFGGPMELVNLGTFRDVVHEHDEHRRIAWCVEWTFPDQLTIADPDTGKALYEGDRLRTLCEVGTKGHGARSRLLPMQLTYEFADARFSLRPKNEATTQFELAFGDDALQPMRNRGRPKPLPQPVKTHLFPSATRIAFQNTEFLAEFELRYEQLMDSIHYLGPLREYPQREYHWAGSSPEDVGQRGERTVDALLAATRDGETRSLGYRKRAKPFQEMIAHWLRELGLIHEFHIDEIAPGTNLYRAAARTTPQSAQVGLTDIGFGVSQVLPALVLLYYVPEGATVVLEQPEIHLHPAVQSGLADVMLNVSTARNLQIIVESHSEHLLRRLQRRVADETVPHEHVKLYFVSAVAKEAQVTDLALNLWGEVENWPDRFFGDEVGEIAAIATAASARRLAAAG